MGKGYIQVYTGNGKGKTTAMLGLTLRACGAGLRVYIGQFMKNMEYSEVRAIREYLPNAEIKQYGTGCIFNREVSRADIEPAELGLEKALEAMLSGNYDIIILDEINISVHLGLLKVSDVLDFIQKKPENIELVLTGRNACAEIIEAADLVSEINEVKHYYQKGIMARTGIEK